MNFLAILTASLVPLALGAVWFHPKVFGNAIVKASGNTPTADMKQGHPPKVYIITFFMSLILAFFIQFMVVHQYHINSLFYKQPINDPNTPSGALYKSVMDMLGKSYRTFKHGALHGFLGGLTIVTPVLTMHCLFEGKGFKYIALNALYWVLSMMIMGGIVSAWM